MTMTDGRDPVHPAVEALSEWIDGAAPQPDAVGAHVAACELCQGRLAELRRGRDAVARPVPPLATARRDEAIARALAAVDAWGQTEPAPATPSALPAPLAPSRSARSRWWLGGSAAAAVVLLVVAAAALFGRGTGSSTNTALKAGPAASTVSGARGAAADSSVSGGDLGDVPNVDVLRARVAASTVTREQAPLAAAPNPAAAGGQAASGAPPVPNVVGTRVCEEQARALHPELGPVVYAASLRFAGTSAVALGFASTPSAPPSTLLVLAPQEGCRLLAATSAS
jgi:hypothetical protein